MKMQEQQVPQLYVFINKTLLNLKKERKWLGQVTPQTNKGHPAQHRRALCSWDRSLAISRDP